MLEFQSDDIDFNNLLSDISSDTFSTTSEEPLSVDSDDYPKKPYEVNKYTASSSYIIKRPRRNRNDPFPLPEWKAFAVTKPTIVKSDIRRSYSTMLANVLNSGEFSLLFGFLDTFFVPGFEQAMTKQSPITMQPYQVLMTGVEAVATLWYSMINLNPDPVVGIKDTKIHMISNSACTKIVSEYTFTATSIYDHHHVAQSPCSDSSEDGNNTNHPPQSAFNQPLVGEKRKGSTADKESLFQSVVKTVESMKANLPLRPVPLAISNVGTVVLYTDENKFITRMEMDMREHDKTLC